MPYRSSPLRHLASILPLLAVLILLTSCASQQRAGHPAVVAVDVEARELPIFDGADGRPLVWDDLIARMELADVIVVGEQHDDAVGHALQLAVVEDAMARWPDTTLSMEMLERDEQRLVDDFLDDLIDAEMLATLTRSTNWGGVNGWAAYYQPMVDAASEHGASVVAANAPRRYARLARTDGYEPLEALPPERRALVDLPSETDDEGYRERFFGVMGEHDEDTPGLSDEELESYYRGQQVWDATMAGSIVAARTGGGRVIHLVGQFHSDFGGGTVQQVQARLPDARVLVISMQKERSRSLREEDVGRADIVVYTGR